MNANDHCKKPTREQVREARIAGFTAAIGHHTPEKRDRMLKEYILSDARREANVSKLRVAIGSGSVAEPECPLHREGNHSPSSMQRLLKPGEVAEIINVTVPTVMRWYHEGIIPARIHVGRVIRFELEPVMAALEEARKVPRADEFFRRRKPTKRTR